MATATKSEKQLVQGIERAKAKVARLTEKRQELADQLVAAKAELTAAKAGLAEHRQTAVPAKKG